MIFNLTSEITRAEVKALIADAEQRILWGYTLANKGAENVITNGELSANTTGWTNISTSNYTYTFVDDDYLQLTAKRSGGEGLMYSNYYAWDTPISGPSAEEESLVYMYARVRGRIGNAGWPRAYASGYANGTTEYDSYSFYERNGLTGPALNDGEWHLMSRRFSTYNFGNEVPTNYEWFRVGFGIAPFDAFNSANNITEIAVGDEMDIKDFCVFNLTEIFGRGNEPSKEWCDAHMAGPEYV